MPKALPEEFRRDVLTVARKGEAHATRDVRRLCDLFGLSVKGAERYLAPFQWSSQNTST